jgi:DNA-binding NarL/FixJ family response regulator
MRILLVDDEPPALERLEAFFRNMADVEVVGTASNGVEANAAIAAFAPDLVMPSSATGIQRDGYRLAHRRGDESGSSPLAEERSG